MGLATEGRGGWQPQACSYWSSKSLVWVMGTGNRKGVREGETRWGSTTHNPWGLLLALVGAGGSSTLHGGPGPQGHMTGERQRQVRLLRPWSHALSADPT